MYSVGARLVTVVGVCRRRRPLSSVFCNAAGGRAAGRRAGLYSYVALGQPLVILEVKINNLQQITWATQIRKWCPNLCFATYLVKDKGKGFPYSLPSVGPGADSGVKAARPQVTISHPPGCRL